MGLGGFFDIVEPLTDAGGTILRFALLPMRRNWVACNRMSNRRDELQAIRAMRQRLQDQIKRDQAALSKLIEAEALLSPKGEKPHGNTPRSSDGRTQVETVKELLAEDPETWFTVAEIAGRTGLSPGAIRTVTYAGLREGVMEQDRTSPKRVKWRWKSR